MHVHGPHTTALGVDRAQRFTQRGAISNDLWHDEAFKQRNLAVKHKKERAAHAKHVKGRAKRGLAMLRMTAKEIGSKVAMEHQLCTLHPPQHTVLRLWAVWLSLAAVVLRYTDASVHPVVLPLRTAALYRETDETSLFEEDWAQMSIVRLASSEEEMLEIQKVLLEHYHTLRELYRVYSNAMGSNHTASAEAFNLSLNEFTSFCHDCRIGHGLIRSVPVPRVFRQAVMGVGGHDAVLASTPGPSSRHSSDGGSGSTAALADILGLPVLLVMDVRHQAQTAAAIAAGMRALLPDNSRMGGVVLNRVASSRHEQLIATALGAYDIALFGSLPSRLDITVPSRHLGLVQAADLAADHRLEPFLEATADLVDRHLDLDSICAAAGPIAPQDGFPGFLPPPGQRVAIAKDAAFGFSYLHMLRYWQAAGGS